MLNAGTWCGDAAVAQLLCLRDATLGSAFALDMHAPTGLRQRLFALGAGVTAIGIYVAARVSSVEQFFKDGGVGDGGVGDGQFADQLATLVDAGVQLITEVVLAMLLRPARVDVLLGPLVWFPRQRYRAFFDGLGFVAFVALDRRLHQRGVDDLAAACQIAVLLQLLLDLLEHECASAGLGQEVAEQPDRLGVGDAAAFDQIEELQEATRSSN